MGLWLYVLGHLSSLTSIQVTKMIHFCFSVTQDCLQLIADSDTPTIRKGNIIVPVSFPLRIKSSPFTCKFQVRRLFKLHLESTLYLKTFYSQM